VGFVPDGKFIYAARVENYLRGSQLTRLEARLSKRKTAFTCAFDRLPIKKRGDTWSVGLTKEDAARCVGKTENESAGSFYGMDSGWCPSPRGFEERGLNGSK
jgi:hypothetical protein